MKARRAMAVALSLFVPGAGHMLLGQVKRGVFWLVLLFLILATLPITHLPGLLLGFLGVRVIAAVDAARVEAARLPSAGRSALLVLAVYLVDAGWGVVMRSSIAEAFVVPAGSMIPALVVGDRMFIDKTAYGLVFPLTPRTTASVPKRGDVVVFPAPDRKGNAYVKRVIGLPGEKISIVSDLVQINGAPLLEPHPITLDPSQPSGQFPDSAGCPSGMASDGGVTCTVPEGKVFVLGDNRRNSHDSRQWGGVAVETIKGRASFVYFSSSPSGVAWSRVGASVR